MRLPPHEAKHFMVLYVMLIAWSARRLDPKSAIHDARSFLDAPWEEKAGVRVPAHRDHLDRSIVITQIGHRDHPDRAS